MSINEWKLQGTVPTFENSIRIFNGEDETKAVVFFKFNVKSSWKKDSNGHPVSDTFDVRVFKKAAMNFARLVRPGAAIFISGELEPSTRRTNNGQPVLGSDGKQIWDPMYLKLNSWTFQEVSYGPAAERNGAQSTAQTATAMPAAMPGAMPAAPQTTNAVGAFPSFDVGAAAPQPQPTAQAAPAVQSGLSEFDGLF